MNLCCCWFVCLSKKNKLRKLSEY